ncbi:MAG: carboxymuconolactone decarboxylase family protein, partial [Spirochaetia bacterium]
KKKPEVSEGFQIFNSEAEGSSKAWSGMIAGLTEASALDPKTRSLAYLAVLAALRIESGVAFHVKAAKREGASREEVISAVLVGLPAAGHVVTEVLPAAVEAFDEE